MKGSVSGMRLTLALAGVGAFFRTLSAASHLWRSHVGIALDDVWLFARRGSFWGITAGATNEHADREASD